MDLNKKMQEITDNVIENQLEDILTKQITSTLTEIVRESFREYSDFGKKLKDAIGEKMNVSLKKLELVNYNQFIIDIIENQMSVSQTEAVEPIKEAINEIVGIFDQKQIKLSDIFDRFKNDVINDSCDESGELTFGVEKSEEYGWTSIYMDPDSDKSEYSCKFSFTIHKSGSVYGFRYKDFSSSDLKKVTPAMLSKFDSFEKWLFRIFNSKVEVVIDETEFETEWYKYEDY